MYSVCSTKTISSKPQPGEPAPPLFMKNFYCFMAERHYGQAIDFLHFGLTSSNFPDPKMVRDILETCVLGNQDESIYRSAMIYLQKMAFCHPCKDEIRKQLYMKIIMSELNCNVITKETCKLGAGWGFFESFISMYYETGTRVYLSVIDLFIQILECDIQCWVKAKSHIGSKENWPLVAMVMKMDISHGGMNSTCTILAKVFGELLAKKDVPAIMVISKLVKLMVELNRLVSLGNTFVSNVVGLSQSNKLKDILVEILKSYKHETPEYELKLVQPTWLRLSLLEELLKQFELLEDHYDKPKCLDLSVINQIIGSQIYHYAASDSSIAMPRVHHDEPFGRKNPLHDACYYQKVQLLDKQLPLYNINARNQKGFTPLNIAILNSSIDCVKALLGYCPPEWRPQHVFDNHIDLLCRQVEGMTPLHLAIVSKNKEIVSLLLNMGGPSLLFAKCSKGKPPVGYAEAEIAIFLNKFLKESENVDVKHNVGVVDFLAMMAMVVETYVEAFMPRDRKQFRANVSSQHDPPAAKLLRQLDADERDISLFVMSLFKLSILAEKHHCREEAGIFESIAELYKDNHR